MAYEEVAVAKIAHSRKLMSRVPEQDLNGNYRNEQALTVALMGLFAEDHLIGVRLGIFGKKEFGAVALACLKNAK